jgi:methionyl-tRNA synthetase
MATVLYVLAETIRNVAIVLQPFVPDAAAKILDQLAVAENTRGFANVGESGALVPGTSLPAPRGVFPRLEAETAV